MQTRTALYKAQALYRVLREASLSSAERDRLVHKRLDAVLVSAYQHVPYYRDIMQAANYDPARDYKSPSDLKKLPITTKAGLRRAGLAATTKCGSDLSRAYKESTSGSTGIPITVYRSPDERAFQIAKWLRVLFANGYSARDRVMSFTVPHRIGEGRSFVQGFGFFRREALPFAILSTEELADRLISYDPNVLYGNRSHLELVALELQRRAIPCLHLKLLVVTGEVILDSHRQLFRRQFGVEPTESYGSVEAGIMAYETPDHQGLVLCDDQIYFEFLDEDGMPSSSGVPTRIVVTDLTRTLQPFIRYDHGDLVVYERHDQDDATSERRLTKIVGRDSDYALLTDGTRLTVHDLEEILDEFEGISQYRAMQRAPGKLLMLIAIDPDRFGRVRAGLLQRYQETYPDKLELDVVRVDSIEPDPSGKLRAVISELDPGTMP